MANVAFADWPSENINLQKREISGAAGPEYASEILFHSPRSRLSASAIAP
jgi:hypothetical protein